ncbi:MAG: hypothetical protein IKX23_08460 [Treponema sp.]|nr:hypothetical protein [Treponema sp.]
MKHLIKKTINVALIAAMLTGSLSAAAPKKPTVEAEQPEITVPKTTETKDKNKTLSLPSPKKPKTLVTEPVEPKKTGSERKASREWYEEYNFDEWFFGWDGWTENDRFDSSWDYWDEWYFQDYKTKKNTIKLSSITGKITTAKEYGETVYKITTKNNKVYNLALQEDLDLRLKPKFESAPVKETVRKAPKKTTTKKTIRNYYYYSDGKKYYNAPKKPSVTVTVTTEVNTPKTSAAPKKTPPKKAPVLRKPAQETKPKALSKNVISRYKNKIITVNGYFNERDNTFVVVSLD